MTQLQDRQNRQDRLRLDSDADADAGADAHADAYAHAAADADTHADADADADAPARTLAIGAIGVTHTSHTSHTSRADGAHTSRASSAMMTATVAVRVSEVSRTYRDRAGASVQALDGVSLHTAEHEVLAVVGPSGCGKTTLLELVCGLQQPDAGTVQSMPAALMPQRDLLMPWLSALDNAALALRIARVSRAQARARAQELFGELGLAGFERARPHELSGGMRQRVAFARTLLAGKEVLCLDEPFGALDAITRAEMHAWLTDALAHDRSEIGRRTVVLVTHDVEEAVVLADRVVVLAPRPGRVVSELEIDLPRPRRRTDPEVVALRERALEALAFPAPAYPPASSTPPAPSALSASSTPPASSVLSSPFSPSAPSIPPASSTPSTPPTPTLSRERPAP